MRGEVSRTATTRCTSASSVEARLYSGPLRRLAERLHPSVQRCRELPTKIANVAVERLHASNDLDAPFERVEPVASPSSASLAADGLGGDAGDNLPPPGERHRLPGATYLVGETPQLPSGLDDRYGLPHLYISKSTLDCLKRQVGRGPASMGCSRRSTRSPPPL